VGDNVVCWRMEETERCWIVLCAERGERLSSGR